VRKKFSLENLERADHFRILKKKKREAMILKLILNKYFVVLGSD